MTVAEEIIKPTKAGIFRNVFLYTGQGESTLLVIPTGPAFMENPVKLTRKQIPNDFVSMLIPIAKSLKIRNKYITFLL